MMLTGGKKTDLRLVLGGVVVVAGVCSMGASLRSGPAPGPHEAFGGRAEIVIKDVPYVADRPEDKQLRLDIYSNPHEGLWPVVVMIHGGGWIEGDKTMDNKVWICKCLANNGYVTFTINYRLMPRAKLKKQAEDCMAAVIWVKQHAL
jgi:acetyl esterase/lipase